VNMKRVESLIETRIMIMINKDQDRGHRLDFVKHYFDSHDLRTSLQAEIPGWFQLSHQKRVARVNKIISRLIKGGRARTEMVAAGDYSKNEYLIPLNVLDKIVFALEQEETERFDEDALA